MDNNLTPMNLLTKVRVLRGVPFDSNYRNVCDGYSSADDQYTKITTGRVKYTFDNVSPIRHQNVLRLPVCADYLYDCNYLVWQNANFTNKWFYAFITKVDWININCCHVHYEIDVWNTGYYDGMTSDRTARGWQIERSFVEREHTNNDTVGANLVPEGLETGEYVWNGSPQWTHFSRTSGGDSNLKIAFLSTMHLGPAERRFDDYYGKLYKNVFSGLNIHIAEESTVAQQLLELASREHKIDGIKGLFMCPSQFYDASQYNHVVSDGVYDSVITWGNVGSIQGYGVPRNKKLLTYPYCFMHVTNNQGNAVDYRYEYFSDPDDITLRVRGSLIDGVPEFMIYPTSYKNQSYNLDEKIVLANFPVCSWNSDTFWDWYSNNRANVASGLISSAVSMAGGVQNTVVPATPNYMTQMIGHYSAMNELGDVSHLPTVNPASVQGSMSQGALQGAIGIGNILANTYLKSTLPPTSHGTPSATTQTAFGFTDYTYGDMTIKPQFARIIDDYFDRFGYATHETKLPNLRGRAQWNYVKTVECSVEPLKMSLEFAPILEQMFDNGVTIWHNINNIGNYSLSNPIVNNLEGDESDEYEET